MTPLTARLWFFAKFVGVAAVFFLLWAVGGATAYTYAVLIGVSAVSPLLTGYEVIIGTGAHGLTAFFEAGASRVETPFVLHEALAGVIPFLALMCASSFQSVRQWAARTAIGILILFVAHVAVLTISPLLVTDHEWWITRIIDVSYGFYAVAGFVGLPFSLWIALTRPWEGPRVVVPTPVPVAVPAKKAATRRKR